MKALKIIGIILAALLAVLLVVPLAVAPRLGDIVKHQANEMLTARVDFRDLKVSLLRHFPHASVELTGLTVVTDEPFAGDTLAAVDRVSVVVNLLSLFGDEGYEVTKVLVDKPFVAARKLADGRVNWDIVKPSETGEPADASAETPAEEPSDASPFRIQLRDVRLDNAVVRYADDSTGLGFGVDPLSLRLQGDMSADRTELHLGLEAAGLDFSTGGVKMLNRADLQADLTLDADLQARRFTFTENTVSLNAIALTLDGWVALGDQSTEMDLTLGAPKIDFRELLSLVPAFYTRDFDQLTASGELSLAAWAKGTMQGDRMPAFGLELKVRDGSFKYAALPQAVSGIRIDAAVANPGGTLDATTVEVPAFSLALAGNTLDASFGAATPLSDLRFHAAARGKIDLGAIREVYPLDDSIRLQGVVTADMRIAGRMSDVEKERYEQIDAAGTLAVEGIDARLAGLPDVAVRRAAATVTPRALTLSELDVQVGRSDLRASGSLSNYIGYLLRGATLKGQLSVASTRLDLNELTGAASAETPQAPADDETPAADTTQMQTLVVPENLDLALRSTVDEILFQRMTLRNFTGNLTLRGGTLSMDRLALEAFGGKVDASGSYSTAGGKNPALKLDARFADASFQETFEQLDLVRQLVPLFAKTGGDYSMSLAFDTRLTPAMAVDYNTLQAHGTISSQNIRLQNIALFDQMATVLKNDALRRIEAQDVKISFTVRDGRIATSPFDLKLGGTQIELSGSTGLDATIDYTARVKVSDKGALQTVPVKIGGTFSSPTVTLGVKEAAQEALTNAGQQLIEQVTGVSVGGRSPEEIRAEADALGQKLVDEAKKQREALIDKASGKVAKALAEKAGDALVEKAEEQARKLRDDAEARIAGQEGAK